MPPPAPARATPHSVWATAQRTAALLNVLSAPRPDVDEVGDVLRAHGETDPLHLTDADVAAMRAVAGRLRAVFAAHDLEDVVRALNHLLAACPGPIRLTSHEGDSPWHLHLDGHDDAEWGEWFLASSTLALAVLVADRQIRPGGACAAPGCESVFASERSGSTRRFCSRRCATRDRVAAHRRRAR
ncbi:CGNR zinc finger domain-containing protein [Pseudonocardia nigra]|uniref:CGNR zinc finger domain-containing protein n=1 Tax=Pseudonocardia nigra TaxID=1921578 RepID=UPI001C5E4B4A|nr:CGNR zinc finger domain-containing protein [Pseudonocardia nigra]